MNEYLNVAGENNSPAFTKKFTLPNKKVLVKPVIWDDVWLPKGHSGIWGYSGTSKVISVPINPNGRGGLLNTLTDEERNYFESDECPLGFKKGDLAVNSKYWKSKRVIIRKPTDIIKEHENLLELDLSDPEQYLDYVVLRANTGYGLQVAPNKETSKDQANRIVYLSEEKAELNEQASIMMLRTEAFKHLSTITNNSSSMYDVLFVLYLMKVYDKMPSSTYSLEMLQRDLGDIATRKPKDYLAVVNDKSLTEKVMVIKAIKNGDIVIKKNEFFLKTGQFCGHTINDVIEFISDDRNQEVKMMLMADSD